MNYKVVLLFVCGLVLSSCTALQKAAEPDTPIEAKAVAPLWSLILDRHDEMVDTLEIMGDFGAAQAGAYRMDSTLMRKILEEALGGNKDTGEEQQ